MLTQSVTRWSVPSLSAMPDPLIVKALARSFLAGELSVDQIVARGSLVLGRRWRWLAPLGQRYIKAFAGRTRPRLRDVVKFLIADSGFRDATAKYSRELFVHQHLGEHQGMQPTGAASSWDLPKIETVGELADWLGVEAGELEWFADLKGLAYVKRGSKISHYNYRVLAKGDGRLRLIESPKPRLKDLQRQILRQILEKIPVHPSAHGFTRGRSIKTFVLPHIATNVVLRMDLQDFFPSFRAARIQTFFRTIGYPESVADRLGGICTNAVPRSVWRDCAVDLSSLGMRDARTSYSRPHLPQGAPTSPALANLCTYRLDCRLAGLARSVGAEYTRYADDLAFSGGVDLEKRIVRVSTHVAAVLIQEGFEVNHRKTRVMRQGVRQRLAGIVVNKKMNVTRHDFDSLKAILTNCVRLGPESQNRDGQPDYRLNLEGRVGFVAMINPSKGARLRKIFDEIRWN